MTLVQTTLVRMISAVMISDGKRHRENIVYDRKDFTMKKAIWKSILCAMLVTLTACILCIGAFAAKYTCIKSGCTREAAK